MLILRPEEAGFLSYLKEVGVSTHEFKISWNKIKNVQLEVSYFTEVDNNKSLLLYFYLFRDLI